jgi:hypothetical protein
MAFRVLKDKPVTLPPDWRLKQPLLKIALCHCGQDPERIKAVVREIAKVKSSVVKERFFSDF